MIDWFRQVDKSMRVCKVNSDWMTMNISHQEIPLENGTSTYNFYLFKIDISDNVH
jgi:hypothetical protein